ncbi:DUF6869 domain-containing protein [Longimicrobium sp.]|uniref:DUF6869 domain-containing protein n=1 Tax=Longimicrobium sp. TaxID=2029185 RepID=UPI003B3B73CD
MLESRLGPLDIETVVSGYLRYSRRPRDDDDAYDYDHPDTIADDAVRNAIVSAPAPVVWELVRTLLRQVEDDELSFHAAGPLEDLVALRGAELVDEIEAEARQDARFRWALGCIWLSYGALPDAVLERAVRASGGQIKPLPPRTERRNLPSKRET